MTGHHALGQNRRDGTHIAVRRQHDRRILRAHVLIGAHQVGHATGELIACHVVDQQRDGPEMLSQAECPVGASLTEVL